MKLFQIRNLLLAFMAGFAMGVAIYYTINSKKNNLLTSEEAAAVETDDTQKAKMLLKYAETLLGTPYKNTGNTPAGFDCSGFTHYVFKQNGILIPQGSSEQIKVGNFVDKCKAQAGDIVVFTGTNLSQRTPGHVGIVMKNENCLLTFIHASSNGGVKISTTEDGHYQERFLQVRRVIGVLKK